MNEPILDYNYFLYRVYLVDPLKKVKSGEEKTTTNSVNYEVLDISRNGTYGNKKQYGVFSHASNDSRTKLHRSKLCRG